MSGAGHSVLEVGYSSAGAVHSAPATGLVACVQVNV